MYKELEELGLSKKEAKVYLACFEVGAGSAQRIALKCGLPKSTVADTLKNLNEKGLMNVSVKKSRHIFSVSDLSIFQEKIKRQKEAFDKLYPELYALFNTDRTKPRLRFYEGKRGMSLIINEALTEAKEIYAIGTPDEVFKKMPEYFPYFSEERTKRGIPIKAILRDTPIGRERQRIGKYELREVRVTDFALPFNCLAWIWNHKIVLLSPGEDFMILVIEHQQFAAMMKSFFMLLWEKLPALNLNRTT